MPYKEVIACLPDYVRGFFERCVIQKNTTEKAEILVDERISHFIEKSLNQNFDKVDTRFKKTEELNIYLIKTIKHISH